MLSLRSKVYEFSSLGEFHVDLVGCRPLRTLQGNYIVPVREEPHRRHMLPFGRLGNSQVELVYSPFDDLLFWHAHAFHARESVLARHVERIHIIVLRRVQKGS